VRAFRTETCNDPSGRRAPHRLHPSPLPRLRVGLTTVDDLHVPWILVAVARERLFFRPKILRTLEPRIRLAELDGCVFVLAETGMGADRVRSTLDRIEGRCSRAIFAGFAGGLRADLAIGDLVWANEVVAADGHRFRPTSPAPASANRGIVRSSDRLVTTPADKRRLAEEGADVVDMESAAFAAWCDERQVPWQCVRAVSDGAQDSLPADLMGVVVDANVSLGRLARALIRRPSLVGDLWSLSGATRRAARTLAVALAEWLETPPTGR
jgi:adenosylhomocysteine nucleosidase